MKFLLLLSAILFTLISCKTPNSSSAKSENDRKSDSLRAVADSLAIMRNMRSMQSGVHLHNNADLATAAHQDPAKENRIKKVQRERRDERIEAAQSRAEALKRAREERQEKEGGL